MVKRLLVGLLLGTMVGALCAFALSRVVHGAVLGTSGLVLAYAASVVTGVLTGLICGKPIWASEGKIEAGLKAFFGALIAAGGMFAIRRWVHVDVNLTALKLGQGQLGDMPVACLPLIAAVLGGFFELDNSPAPEDGAKKRVGTRSRVATGDGDLAEADEPAEKRHAK